MSLVGIYCAKGRERMGTQKVANSTNCEDISEVLRERKRER